MFKRERNMAVIPKKNVHVYALQSTLQQAIVNMYNEFKKRKKKLGGQKPKP